MVNLHQTEQNIISQLFDSSIFTSSETAGMAQAKLEMIQAMRRPQTVKRISSFLTDLVGRAPYVFLENMVWLVGEQATLSVDQTRVLLATMKAVINEPNVQSANADHLVARVPIIRQVHSVVSNLDERAIESIIDGLLVDRFGLLTKEKVTVPENERNVVVDAYWSVSHDFTNITQALVNWLKQAQRPAPLSAVQQVNRALLARPFISPATAPDLWPALQTHKEEIAALWWATGRYVLECGDAYAVLLDRKRLPSTSKQYITALGVALSLGAGLPEAELGKRIRQVGKQYYENIKTLNPTMVKDALFEFALAYRHGKTILPTALVDRVIVKQEEAQ
ncbi:hypothetical protein [Lacticaseibacillus hegangensis]|uniref:Uncharacterized protein n=1 Tax=Lacticaseibacillus hegangensis TaxID=2486010 RepID=A0ABW4CVI7_9LACO|nr:hypothetical protein [Lacticaseibacillus hegangensis]